MAEIARSLKEPGGPSVGHGSSIEKFIKMSPLAFLGGIDPTVAENWVQEIEKIFTGQLSVQQYAAMFIELYRFALYIIPDEKLVNDWKQRSRGRRRDPYLLVPSRGLDMVHGAQPSPACPSCWKRHLRECRVVRGVCYRCKEPRHMIMECPTQFGATPAPIPT
ncbi:uncharacterized protein LOC131167610 [Malania oleifera]|uniref:uncharacterized protein LOC131167610 n=1 Tax=Malania oleifera TaxID=397392 RepID=UPI0025AE63F3|nr:uncharacterized protein LOC131167610 [Malania oleifera]